MQPPNTLHLEMAYLRLRCLSWSCCLSLLLSRRGLVSLYRLFLSPDLDLACLPLDLSGDCSRLDRTLDLERDRRLGLGL